MTGESSASSAYRKEPMTATRPTAMTRGARTAAHENLESRCGSFLTGTSTGAGAGGGPGRGGRLKAMRPLSGGLVPPGAAVSQSGARVSIRRASPICTTWPSWSPTAPAPGSRSSPSTAVPLEEWSSRSHTRSPLRVRTAWDHEAAPFATWIPAPGLRPMRDAALVSGWRAPVPGPAISASTCPWGRGGAGESETTEPSSKGADAHAAPRGCSRPSTHTRPGTHCSTPAPRRTWSRVVAPVALTTSTTLSTGPTRITTRTPLPS